MNPYHYLKKFDKFGSEGGYKPGLQRINKLLSCFNHPEKNMSIIHVAGSNGKGSTIAMLESIYRAAGYRVGTFTSPPIEKFNERMIVQGQKITTEELTNLVNKIKPVIEKIKLEWGQPTFFEVVTLLAFLFFQKHQPDIVLLEVGLGGRLDATNVIDSPLCSIITSISLEHTAILGSTLQQIAREKAGIIKKGSPVIHAVEEIEARREIEKIAGARHSRALYVLDKYNFHTRDSSIRGQQVMVENGVQQFSYSLSMPGKRQVENSLLALEAVEQLQEKFYVSKKDLTRGLGNVSWPGRMEVIRESPLILLDGAHNPAAFGSLIEVLAKETKQKREIHMILSILDDKNVTEMVKLLLPLSEKLNLIITDNGNPRAESPAIIARCARDYNLNYRIISDIKTAVQKTLLTCSPDDLICITGSLYTVSAARKELKNY